MEYLINNNKYHLSYKELQEQYWLYCRMSNDDFIKNLSGALHLACVILWDKRASIDVLNDEGLIHQLIHLLDIPNEPLIRIQNIREDFEQHLKLD
jgi:hypothetical protein